MNFIQQIDALDWTDFEKVSLQSQELLQHLTAHRRLLGQLIHNCILNKSEQYDLLTKLVLLERPNGTRLRLHVFTDEYYDRPHNHRWPYSALILRGGCVHRIFSSSSSSPLETTAENLTPLLIEKRGRGVPYTLNTQVFHSVSVVSRTISLIIRGPARERSFRLIDRQTGEHWVQHGADHETSAEHEVKRLQSIQFYDCIRLLKSEGVIDG